MSGLVRTVACAISGGVDSAVAAFLLKKKGFNVRGVFMTNWDSLDEGFECSVSRDRLDAKAVCEHLQIPFVEVNFVREYWIYVFQPLLNSYRLGLTPNPDVLCNRFVKFNLLAKKLFHSDQPSNDFPTSITDDASLNQVDAIATGHYCQNSFGNFLEKPQTSIEPHLLRSVDPVKDQTFWLATIPHQQLGRFMFPVGSLMKPEVKQIAADIGLKSTATRRESMGMCFIGKRKFAKFIDSYITEQPGVFRDFSTGIVLDEHNGIHHYTIGQRANISKVNGPFYVARMDADTQDIYVVRDPYHPCLFMRKCWTGPVVWINSQRPQLPSDKIQFQWQNKWKPINCRLKPHNTMESAVADVQPSSEHMSRFLSISSRLLETVDESCERDRASGPFLSIELEVPMRCVVAGQWAALYDGPRCLGGTMLCGSISLWDEGQTVAYTNWKYSDFEISYENR